MDSEGKRKSALGVDDRSSDNHNSQTDEPSPKRQRRSFLSPTRASMSRHNSDVLGRHTHEESSPQAPTSTSQQTAQATIATDTKPSAQLIEHISPNVTTLSRPSFMVQSGGNAKKLSDGGNMSVQPKRTMPSQQTQKSSKGVLKPVALRRHPSDAVKNPFKGRTLRRSPPIGMLAPSARLSFSQSASAETPSIEQQSHQPEFSVPVLTSPGRWKQPHSTSSIRSDVDISMVGGEDEIQGSDAGAAQAISEPELPPTPTQRGILDPIVTTPPDGIHNITSKQKQGTKKSIKHSPLKQPPLTAHNSDDADASLPTAVATTSPISHTLLHQKPPLRPRSSSRSEPFVVHEDKIGLTRSKDKVKDATVPHSLRHVPLLDSLTAKKNLRARLVKEIKQTKRDIHLAQRMNAHLSSIRLSGSDVWKQDEEAKLLLDLLYRTEVSKQTQENFNAEKKAQRTMERVQDVVRGMLGFGSAGISAVKIAPIIPLVSSQSGTGKEQDKCDESKQQKTHFPLQLSSSEALPFLQAFSPLRFSSEISMSTSFGNSPIQTHRIRVISPGDGLFTAQIEMQVDSMVPCIQSLAFPAIISSARAELKPFLDKISRLKVGDKEVDEYKDRIPRIMGLGMTTSVQNNITLAGWAMGEWYRVALRRARIWAVLDAEMGTIEGVRVVVKKFRQGFDTDNRDKRQRSRRDLSEWEERDKEDDIDKHEGKKGEGISKRKLALHMGRRSMEIAVPFHGSGHTTGNEDDEGTLRLDWDIEFDWTGEAQSRISALIGVPGKWYGHDGVKGLENLFGTFVDEEKDPMVAVRTVVALLAREK